MRHMTTQKCLMSYDVVVRMFNKHNSVRTRNLRSRGDSANQLDVLSASLSLFFFLFF